MAEDLDGSDALAVDRAPGGVRQHNPESWTIAVEAPRAKNTRALEYLVDVSAAGIFPHPCESLGAGLNKLPGGCCVVTTANGESNRVEDEGLKKGSSECSHNVCKNACDAKQMWKKCCPGLGLPPHTAGCLG